MNYLDIRNEIKEGDVIVFSDDSLVGNLIKLFSSSIYTHVGIVIKADLGVGMGDRLMIVESSFSIPIPNYQMPPDAITRKIRSGVQMHWLSRKIEECLLNGEKLWLLTLKEALTEDQLFTLKEWLNKQHLLEIKYDFSQPLGAALDMLDKLGLENRIHLGSLFCSELVATALYKVGLFDGNPSEQTPADIVKMKCFSELIPITKEAQAKSTLTGFMPAKFKNRMFEW
jgi:hypothetical protein